MILLNGGKEGSASRRPLPNPFLRRLQGTAEGSYYLPYWHEISTWPNHGDILRQLRAELLPGATGPGLALPLALEFVGGPWYNLGGSKTRPLSKPILFLSCPPSSQLSWGRLLLSGSSGLGPLGAAQLSAPPGACSAPSKEKLPFFQATLVELDSLVLAR